MPETLVQKESPQSEIETELLAPLNPVQRQGVAHVNGPLLIVAGAGSGKTRVITHRIAYLVRVHGLSPWNIAALTFTNKAAEEMRIRLEGLIGPMARNVFVRTFHSLGLYIISHNPEALGLKSGFSIVDQSGQKSLIKSILKEEKLEQNFLEPAAIANQINKARDSMMSPDALIHAKVGYAEEMAHIYKIYIRRLRRNNSLDFGDLLYESVRLMEKDPELQKRYSQLWRHFLIDEYQDTNHVQYRLGRLIAKDHKNIMVVGDDDQSIYSWRGADIQNILSFEKDYPHAKILKLEENYRSTAVILQAASSLIANNSQRRDKTLFTSKTFKEGSPIFYQSYDDENTEAYGVTQQIMDYRSRQIPLEQMAIFYRTNAQSRVFERILRENNLPYVIVGDIRFYERKEIKDLLAYLSLIVNPEDDLSLERIINVPARGIGQTGLRHLQALALSQDKSLLASLLEAESIPNLRSHRRMKALHGLFQNWRKLHLAGLPPSEIAERVIEDSGYLEALRNDASFESEGRIANLSEFISSLKEYEEEYSQSASEEYDSKEIENAEIEDRPLQPDLGDFLQSIALYTNEKKENTADESCLYLMTLHNAKSLEYRCVFLCGAEEDYLPHKLSVGEGNIEEERRLLYVGITRAREYLHISYARERRLFGSLQPRLPSPFIEEIDPELFATKPQNTHRSHSTYEPSASFTRGSAKTAFARSGGHALREAARPLDLETYSPGEQVYHQRYGQGIVLKAEKMPIGQKLCIQFESESRTRLFLSQYTPLSKKAL